MTGSSQLVLVADDDPDILQLIELRILRLGHEVITARDGDRALALARERRPALAVLDVGMPGLSGYEVTEALRADPATSGIPIVLLTARVQEADVDSGFAAGANAYVKKPFSAQELGDRVRALLG